MGSTTRIIFHLLAFVLLISQTHQREINIRNFPPQWPSNRVGTRSVANQLTDSAEFVQMSNEFAIQLYKQVSAQAGDENVVISPLSIGACLSLAAMGAGRETADEILSGLLCGKSDQKQQVADWYGRLMHRLADDESIDVANKVYVALVLVKGTFQFSNIVKRSFEEMASYSFRSDVERINFAWKEGAAKRINDCVAKYQWNKIKDLIDAEALDDLTRIVLVSSAHFHARWKHKFEPFDTRPMPFWFSDTESRDVPMMHIEEDFLFHNFEAKGFSALELAFEGSYVTMLVLLPHKYDGLAALEENLASLNLAELRDRMTGGDVAVYLPKFKIDVSLDLQNVLTALGMGRMFTDEAEFPNLLESNETFKVSKAMHKAFIDVTEDGIEAQFLPERLGQVFCAGRYPTPPLLVVKADHPFIYMLSSEDKGVYFIGKVTNPG